MFIYNVFRVATSTAPLYQGNPTKLIRIGSVKANNSTSACSIVRDKIGANDDVTLLAHQIYSAM